VTLHYHGTPITPRSVLLTLAGKCFFVSYARPENVVICHDIGQSVGLDSGAFTHWRRGLKADWNGYCAWAEPWLAVPTTWAVIPDVIDGSEAENDSLIAQWPFGTKGAPVWHLNECLDRLYRLCTEWPRVCFGSTSAYAVIGSPRWEARMDEAFNMLGAAFRYSPLIHMLRGMALSGQRWPFASLDSSDVGRNHHRPQNTARVMADRWDARQCAQRWVVRPMQHDLIYDNASVAPPA
jgi:hypothetical protein